MLQTMPLTHKLERYHIVGESDHLKCPSTLTF